MATYKYKRPLHVPLDSCKKYFVTRNILFQLKHLPPPFSCVCLLSLALCGYLVHIFCGTHHVSFNEQRTNTYTMTSLKVQFDVSVAHRFSHMTSNNVNFIVDLVPFSYDYIRSLRCLRGYSICNVKRRLQYY